MAEINLEGNAPYMHLKMLLMSTGSRRLFSVLFFICVFASTLFISGSSIPQPKNLDHSWHLGLEYAVLHHFQFGRDIVFTYGPLGFLNSATSQGGLVVLRLCFAILWSFLVAASATLFCCKLSGVSRYLFVVWMILFSNPAKIYLGLDPNLYLVVAAGAYLLLLYEKQKAWIIIFISVLFALLALIKFTFFIAVSSVVVICFLIKLLEKQFQIASVLVAFFVASFVLYWALCGQDVSLIPLWIANSIEVASAYNRAMSVLPGKTLFQFAFAMLVIYASLVVYILCKMPRRVSSVGYLLCMILLAFLSWKHGFVRAEEMYVSAFMGTFPILAGITLALLESKNVSPLLFPSIPYTAILVLGFFSLKTVSFLEIFSASPVHSCYQRVVNSANNIGKVLTGNMASIFPPPGTVKSYVQSYPFLALPIISASTKQHPVDFMNCGQLAIFANGMNWQPRPVIQGYSAYSSYLQQLNAEFIRTRPEPSFILCLHQTIDDRFPTLDDSAAFNSLLRNYRPRIMQNDYILLEKLSSDRIELLPFHEQTLKFGETLEFVSLNNEPIFASIAMSRTVAGRILAFLFQEFPLKMTVETESAKKDYRYVPIMGELPFLLSPLVENNYDIINIYKGLYNKNVRRITFRYLGGLPIQYENSFKIRLYRTAKLTPLSPMTILPPLSDPTRALQISFNSALLK